MCHLCVHFLCICILSGQSSLPSQTMWQYSVMFLFSIQTIQSTITNHVPVQCYVHLLHPDNPVYHHKPCDSTVLCCCCCCRPTPPWLMGGVRFCCLMGVSVSNNQFISRIYNSPCRLYSNIWTWWDNLLHINRVNL